MVFAAAFMRKRSPVIASIQGARGRTAQVISLRARDSICALVKYTINYIFDRAYWRVG